MTTTATHDLNVGDWVTFPHEPVTGEIIGISPDDNDRPVYRVEFHYSRGFAAVRSFSREHLTFVGKQMPTGEVSR